MRKIVATLLVGAAFALLNATGAFAASDVQNRPTFYGDGFDNATCADMPQTHSCR
jgi:hypothetical protein